MAPRYELAVGLKRGHKTTKIERVGKVSGKELSAKSEKLRQARTKGVSNIVQNIILVTIISQYFLFTNLASLKIMSPLIHIINIHSCGQKIKRKHKLSDLSCYCFFLSRCAIPIYYFR